jgi:hypothetical protein
MTQKTQKKAQKRVKNTQKTEKNDKKDPKINKKNQKYTRKWVIIINKEVNYFESKDDSLSNLDVAKFFIQNFTKIK